MPTLPKLLTLPKQKWCRTVCFVHFVDYSPACLPLVETFACMLPILKIVLITIMNHIISYSSSGSDPITPFFFFSFLFFFIFFFSFLLGEKYYLWYNIKGKSISHYRKAGCFMILRSTIILEGRGLVVTLDSVSMTPCPSLS